ncbi:metal-dependent hydrolase [Litorimonas cladophorae]|uniref:Metal-dependent hydrolase n=1 Tax=Litorimonas cladophorae TaxID=1220491 RepID=A0A918NHD0_9PROT|nr:SprT family zinc-dependent metalloprotease [Litorimonas cladophorae]GGX73225.1 metal-dependent hydrolase [Litorimonas cladophorae]
MSGFLKSLLGVDDNMPARPSKADFPLRDGGDPRVLYVHSDRARRISLKVKAGSREVHVVVPGTSAFAKARQFAQQQRDWIDVQLEALPSPQPFVPGGEILFQGQPFRLVNPTGRGRAKIDRIGQKIIVPSPDAESFPGRVRRFLIREARAELEAASHHYAEKLDKRVGKVSIRDTESRWGSCITRQGEGHISYSWRLICAPPHVLEYVCAHECAHMIEANHSAAFWAVCDRIFDDVKSAKRWLSKNGPVLHAVGAEF